MKKAIFSLFLSIFALCSSHHLSEARVLPTRASGDDRIRFVNYDSYNVTKIIGSIRSSVQVEFSSDEEIAHIAIGNSVAWEIAPAGNIVFLKPREVQPITNLQIITKRQDNSKRSYQFELMVQDGEISPENETYFLVKFCYPEDEAEKQRIEAQLEKDRKQALRAEESLDINEQYGARNWAYTAQGTIFLEPSSVYDNGKTTTFVFSGSQEIPAIYMINTDGQESLVSKTTKGNIVIVHAIAPQFVLRRGRNFLCIFNEAYQLHGNNPGTGTTSPFVERKIATDL
ncbi:P-type conjugative transfer protein VirB9 [Bartonella sp. A05]|uniref:P-type conjugative transfer protein VirB9 n=1 Tax=Bartonella sp. A05 TaxID=2967261 RepID=UPI0022A9164B|nr:P-type conjugative transfer protein VirB9 [Bartonella sp. A05]MCZ2204479.1 P-type conjugative transfer protein VirB9 [Bartonella sp. A05]